MHSLAYGNTYEWQNGFEWLKFNCMIVMAHLHGPELYTNDLYDIYNEQVVL